MCWQPSTERVGLAGGCRGELRALRDEVLALKGIDYEEYERELIGRVARLYGLAAVTYPSGASADTL